MSQHFQGYSPGPGQTIPPKIWPAAMTGRGVARPKYRGGSKQRGSMGNRMALAQPGPFQAGLFGGGQQDMFRKINQYMMQGYA